MNELHIEYLPIEDLEPYEKNARLHRNEDISQIQTSIEMYGFNDPIGIWSDHNVIVEGHGRFMAARGMGLKTVPVIRLDHLTDEQRRQYAIAHNRTAELSEWDWETLKIELEDLDFQDLDLSFPDIDDDFVENAYATERDRRPEYYSATSYDEDDDGADYEGTGYEGAGYSVDDGGGYEPLPPKGSLADKFLIPPVSIFRAAAGDWTARKRIWMGMGIRSEVGRGENLAYSATCADMLKKDGKYKR